MSDDQTSTPVQSPSACAQCGKQKRVTLDMTPSARAREFKSGVIIPAGTAWKICARCWIDGLHAMDVEPKAAKDG